MSEVSPDDYYAIRVSIVHVVNKRDTHLGSMARVISKNGADELWKRIDSILSEGAVSFEK